MVEHEAPWKRRRRSAMAKFAMAPDLVGVEAIGGQAAWSLVVNIMHDACCTTGGAVECTGGDRVSATWRWPVGADASGAALQAQQEARRAAAAAVIAAAAAAALALRRRWRRDR